MNDRQHKGRPKRTATRQLLGIPSILITSHLFGTVTYWATLLCLWKAKVHLVICQHVAISYQFLIRSYSAIRQQTTPYVCLIPRSDIAATTSDGNP